MINKIYLTQILILLSIVSYAQTHIIKGKVTSDGMPIEFATLVVAGTNYGAISAKNGDYHIENISKDTCELIASLIGYKTQHTTVLLNKTIILKNISLEKEPSELNQIVISGVSKATLIKENPLPIVAISTRQIEQTTESNVIDALSKNAPGLDAVKTGPNVSKPFINGLGYNRVLTLYDGMRVETQQWGDEHGVPIDDYNIERAEVIKGPASLMYGSDAVAGVLSIFPPIPTGKKGIIKGKFLSEYQNNNGLIGNALRLGYCGNHWLWAFRGSYRIAKNYTNSIDGRVYNTGFRTKNCSGLIGYNGEKGFTHLTFTFYDNLQGIPDGSRDSLSRKFTNQLNEAQGENTLLPQYDDIKNRPVVSDNSLNSYNLNPLHQHIQDYRLYSDNNFKFNDGDLKILLGFEQNARREYDHPTDIQQAGMYVVLNTVNYNIHFNFPSFLNIETSIGVNGMYQNNKNMDATDFPIPNYDLFDAGGYVYAKWKMNKWTIGGGLRYDFRNVNGQEMYIKSNPLSGFFQQVPLNDSAGGTKQFQSFQLQFSGISGSIGTTYQLNKNLSFKANIARGYRAPNITEIASNGLDPGAHIVYEGNLNFVPEFSIQEDAAVKGDFKNETIGVSIFNNNIQNYIYQAQAIDNNGNPVVIVPGNKTFKYQQANAQLYGTAFQFDIHPEQLKGLNFNNRFSVVYGYNRNPKYTHEGTEGEYLPFIPPFKLLSTISQDISLKHLVIPMVTVKAEVEYNSDQKRYLALYNTETFTPSYTLFNMSVHTDIHYTKKEIVQVQMQINNVLDVAYQSHLSRLQYFEYYTQSSNNRLGIYNMGRNVCIKIIVQF